MHILLFGGTSEDVSLRNGWRRGRGRYACVATGYGASLIPSDPSIRVHTSRLDRSGMEGLMREVALNGWWMPHIPMPWRSPEISGLRQKTPGFLISASCGMAVKGTGSACRIWQRRGGSTAVEAAFCSPPGARDLPPFPCRGCGIAAFHGYCPAWTLWGAVWSWAFRPRILCMQGPFPRS